ncbi:MAG: efflux RND transporter permease subunit [Ignavibacteria bacterium]|nr:efflux RND transporter permease subunit [Ignavibacteria bacterium]MBT8382100.1 efflux RND transporter permease subunit [Ignavibacteria bacterium]MBT8392012.1 efflux RND transporter permease subunit [Ignavibacteria bacterium]NNJ51821.1 efflux RND transporter permease subunit [Ignavibacteriaceae bacterium]NNL21890.1 efflux RND transporter permease subunit [Ignavibacteriaceae bacterium]
MKITNVAIDNRTSVFILVVIILIMGISAYVTLPRESSPDISIPLVIVSTPYFGVSPEDIESLITQKIEKEVNNISEVKEITSSSFEGYSLIRVEFESGYDIDEALQKVRDKVNKAEPELPPEVEKPEIVEINFSEFPILVANIAGPYSLVKLKDIAEDLKDEIEKVDGVLDVKVSGGLEREVLVEVDINKLNHYNVRFDDIIGAIVDENKTIPGGSIDVNNSSFLVRVPGEFEKPYIIDNIIVKLKDGSPIYVKDIAEVKYGFEDRQTYARLNKQNAVSISVSKSVGENIIQIAEKVKEILDRKREELPSDAQIYISSDQSVEIEKMVRELENNIFSGLVLVVAVLFFFLGIRNAFFVAIAIPLSMLISFFVLQTIGVTLNFVVLFGLILALGMLVDNAIVIIENIYKFLEEGHKLSEAAKLGTAEVAWPVTTSTCTTVAVFFPLIFWPGLVGEFMLYIPVVLIVTLLSSLFVALIINPVFASRFMKLERTSDKPRTLVEKILYPFNRVTHFFVDVSLPKVLTHYKVILEASLGPIRNPDQPVHKKNWLGLLAIFFFFIVEGNISALLPSGLVIVISFILGVAIIFIFTNMKLKVLWGTFLLLFIISQIYFLFGHGIEFFPETQPPRIYVSLESPSGTNLEMSNEIVKTVEDKITQLSNDDIKDLLVVVGSSNNPFDAGSSTPNKSSITIQFIDFEIRDQSSLKSTDEIRDVIIQTAGTEVLVQKEEAGPPVGLPVNIEISGDDYDVLGSISQMVKDSIKTVTGLVDLKDDFDDGRPEVRVEIDREKAALYGLNTSLIANSVRTAINGYTASKYRVDEDEYDITVRLREDQRSSINALETLEIIYNNKKGETLSVPLISVAKIYKSKGPGAIRRKDLTRVITVSGDAAEGFNENEVLDKVKERLSGFVIPPGYSIDFTGQAEFQQEAQDFLGKAFLIALLLIFLILVIQFNSLSQPLIIMSAVIISLIGVFIGLIIYSMPFGIIMTGIGIISLAGVVVNNNIVLIDYINVLRRRGFTRREALVKAGMRRFRPVTLTAITTILGLIPLTFGIGFDVYTFSLAGSGESAEFWRSMGIAVIFGLAFATVLTLIIVPVIYSTLEDMPGVIRQIKRIISGFFRKIFQKIFSRA